MTTEFSHSLARLAADRGRRTAWTLAAAFVVLGGWGWWSTHAHLTLREISSEARIEVDAAAYPIQSPLLGRVVGTKLRAGQTVRRGDLLVEIDAMANELQWREGKIRADGLQPEIARLRAQVAAEESARAQEQLASRFSMEEAANRIQEAETAAKYAEAEWSRTQALARENLAPRRDVERAEADVRRLRAATTTLASAARRIPQEQATRDRERDARLEYLNSNIVALDAERRALHAGIERLGYEIERRRVRSPADGRIGESAVLRVGAVVHEGENLATLIPSGNLWITAQFPANAAIGKIEAGQTATLRLHGFPWTEFGTVTSSVAHVAEEVRDGKVRVQLAIEPTSSFRGKLEHGMPGTLEIAVDRLTPLALVLRTAGQWLTANR